MEVIDIFKIPVFFQKLSLDNEKILEYCFEKSESENGRRVSNCGGWQSEIMFDCPKEFEELFELISHFSINISDFLQINPVKFANFWVNVNGYKDFNWTHIHSDSIISGVYYVKTPPNSGNIEFECPYLNTISNSANNRYYNSYNSKTYSFPVEENNLYIFPSWIPHKVYPNMNKTEKRISISFNFN